MIRVQIRLTEAQRERLETWARERGISLAEAVRRCVDGRLAHEGAGETHAGRIRTALAACGRHRDPSGAADVATAHDRFLEEAFAD